MSVPKSVETPITRTTKAICLFVLPNGFTRAAAGIADTRKSYHQRAESPPFCKPAYIDNYPLNQRFTVTNCCKLCQPVTRRRLPSIGCLPHPQSFTKDVLVGMAFAR